MNDLSRRIIFVVGAGASADFGFPLGQLVSTAIQNRLDEEFRETTGIVPIGPIRTALNELGFNEGHRDAIQQLRAGIGPGETIDQFLFRRRTNRLVRDLGMMTLASVILDAERESPLMRFSTSNYESSLNALRSTNNSWPAVLLDILIGTKSPEEIDASIFSDIGFVIFNYDRCVEQALFHHLYRRHNLSVETTLNIVRSIPMLHVYGILGDWQSESISFGAKGVQLASIARNIRTYHEELADVEHERRLLALMNAAEKVVFLGFGFHPNNIELLFRGGNYRGAQLMGTAMGAQDVPPFSHMMRANGSRFEAINCTAFLRTFGSRILTEPWRV